MTWQSNLSQTLYTIRDLFLCFLLGRNKERLLGSRSEWNSSARIPKVQASACEQRLPAYLILGPPESPVVSAAAAQGPRTASSILEIVFWHSLPCSWTNKDPHRGKGQEFPMVGSSEASLYHQNAPGYPFQKELLRASRKCPFTAGSILISNRGPWGPWDSEGL